MSIKEVFHLSDETYNVLKWVAIIGLPGLNTGVSAILGATGVASTTTVLVVTIISAIATMLGTWLGISSANYNKTETTDENAEG